MSVVLAEALPNTTADGVATIQSIEGIFKNFIVLAIGFAGIALFVMLIVGGFNFITAGADAGKAQGAQKTITYAILGLIFIVLSFLILRLIGDFTGVTGFLDFTVVQP